MARAAGPWEGLISMLVCKGEGPVGPGLSQWDVFYPPGYGELLKEGCALSCLYGFHETRLLA